MVARDPPADLSEREAEEVDQLERGLILGLRRCRGARRRRRAHRRGPVVDRLLLRARAASVDNVDQLAGKVALVLALDGADGNFGVKDTADSLLPDLIEPSPTIGETES